MGHQLFSCLLTGESGVPTAEYAGREGVGFETQSGRMCCVTYLSYGQRAWRCIIVGAVAHRAILRSLP